MIDTGVIYCGSWVRTSVSLGRVEARSLVWVLAENAELVAFRIGEHDQGTLP
jgi:hypothetical protein